MKSLAILGLVVLLTSGCAAMDGDRPSTKPSSMEPEASTDPTPGVGTPHLQPAASASLSVDRSMDVPSRVEVAHLEIDLPVVSGDLSLPGNPPDYPLCDVAQYLTTYRYPGRPGTTTWLYAHAREGMFVTLLEASERDDGRELIGVEVIVYTTGLRRFTYRITSVHRHATDRSVARDVTPDGGRLVLQTSEGPRGTVPKLQVVAELQDVQDSSDREAMPSPAPRACLTR
jgi:hypothetical protein